METNNLIVIWGLLIISNGYMANDKYPTSILYSIFALIFYFISYK